MKTNILVSYDITNDKIRRALIKILETYGNRIHYSVFLFYLNEMHRSNLENDIRKFYNRNIRKNMDKSKSKLSILIVDIGDKKKIELLGDELNVHKSSVVI